MIDIENEQQLIPYLHAKMGELRLNEPDLQECDISILSGGVSNKTVMVTFSPRRSWVLKQALDKLRVPVDWYCSPDRIHREALGMRLLRPLLGAASVPSLIFEDRHNNLLAMSAVSRPFENWKSMLLDGRIDFRHLRRFARMLAALHAGGMRLRDKLPKELFDLTYFWNLRLEPYYRYTGERIPSAQSFYNELAESCAESRITVVHGDYSPKNILVRRNRLILLDHEVIHFGDPAFDLGFSLTHLLSKAHHLSEHRTLLLAAAQTYWKEYRRRLGPSALREFGPSFEQRVVDHTMGCLLARAAGRSQLEYLDDTAKARQTDAVLELLARRPRSVGELVARFGTRIGETQ